jgi:DNA repair exonuclease SbcCD nuclease subunit
VNSLVISDLHSNSSWPFSKQLDNGLPSRFQDLLNVLTQVEESVPGCGLETLLILGDLTHRRHFIDFRLLNTLWDALHRLASLFRETYIIPGNHDYQDETHHSVHVFSGLPRTHVVDVPTTVKLCDGEDINLIPFMHDPRVVAHAVETMPALPTFAHYAAEGAPMETAWWLDSPIKLGELDRFPQVVFGHVHKPSEQLGGKVIYVGAPLHFDFGDHGPRRFLRMVDGYTDFVQTVAPQFVTAKWPRVPMPQGAGFLRILDVPPAKMEEAKEMAVRMGWLDAVPLEGALPEEVRDAVTSGLTLGEDAIREYVHRRCPELSAEDQEELVQEGLALWQRVRA